MALWILVRILKMDQEDSSGHEKKALLHVLFAVLTAISVFVSPMAFAVLLAVVICLFPVKKQVAVKNVTEQPVSEKILSRGFRCCILILLVFTASLLFFQKGISYAIDGSVNSQVAYLKEIFGAMHGKLCLQNFCISWIFW